MAVASTLMVSVPPLTLKLPAPLMLPAAIVPVPALSRVAAPLTL